MHFCFRQIECTRNLHSRQQSSFSMFLIHVQMSHSSPTIQRLPRLKAPIIATSQDSPINLPYKRPASPNPGVSTDFDVPPSTLGVRYQSKSPRSFSSPRDSIPLGSPVSLSQDVLPGTVASPINKDHKCHGRSKITVSRRQQMLQNPFLDLHCSTDKFQFCLPSPISVQRIPKKL